MIRMLQGIDKEDLETLWKLVKEKHGLNKLVEDYEKVLRGDLKVMFEPDIKSEGWLHGIDREDLETLWKLVKEKHGLNRPVEDYERVLWGDLKKYEALNLGEDCLGLKGIQDVSLEFTTGSVTTA
ncbi:hypothetical protein Tco_1523341 [Tanacetum coccineum]